MLKQVDGQWTQVPDDERITPELVAMRDYMNDFLLYIQGPEGQKIAKMHRESVIESIGDWYCDADVPDASQK